MMAENAFDTAVAPLRDRVDRYLERWLDEKRGELPHALIDAAAYALLGGGKRLRPAMCLLWGRATGAALDACLPAAAAVECIHAFSLVHDDLPAIDNDDLRRGRPTLHVHAGEAMALLAGDLLHALAFDALRGVASGPMPSPALVAAWCRELTNGTIAMIGGQVLDTFPASPGSLNEPEADHLRRVHLGKTAALIEAACRMGALPAGGERELEAANVFGRAVGLCFQAVDDLLDVEATADAVGKRTGKDAAAGKRTYPGILGVDATRAEIAELSRRAADAVTPFGEDAGPLRDLALDLARRTS